MWGIIVNPKSGKKKQKCLLNYLHKKLIDKQIQYKCKTTAYEKHATEIARSFVENGIKNILIIGGDGTTNEVINGIFHAKINNTKDIRIAIIPSGTGNDWGRYWNLTRNYKKAIDIFLHGKETPIDIGKINYTRNGEHYQHYFINSIGFGIDCKVVQLTHKLKYYFGSHSWVYTLALIAAVFKHQPQMLNITANNNYSFTGKLFTMNIGNGCYSGGGLRQNPDAKPTDGIFHAMFMQKPTFIDVAKGISMLFKGNITEHRLMHNIISSQININTANPMPFETDGIPITACGPYSIETLPNALIMTS
ncbi:MAG: YegS/Rv2252/BmrU family lipid kinase [Bacteroidia bacterium]|nr:YegS/Rv2252/BmrU family lipid kinase [Bacteroidia bacterium]